MNKTTHLQALEAESIFIIREVIAEFSNPAMLYSIGCAICTRAIKEGEDIRAGRWWWENPDHKECGLHQI